MLQLFSRHVYYFVPNSGSFSPKISLHATNFNPLPFLPTSQTPHTVQTVPLYLVWYFDPSNAQVAKGEPE
jgi:hypothetical protein